jgi:hypothetical protein
MKKTLAVTTTKKPGRTKETKKASCSTKREANQNALTAESPLSCLVHGMLAQPMYRLSRTVSLEIPSDDETYWLVGFSVNFFGPQDEFVLSGSDDGHFFVWRKGSPGVWSSSHSDLPEGHLHGIYEGDGSVVNVTESHPSLPLLAVSGIDTTVKVGLFYHPCHTLTFGKLFAPARGPSRYSRLANANTILSRNKDSSRRRPMLSNAGDLAQLLMHYNLSVQSAGGAGEGATVRAADCVNQ